MAEKMPLSLVPKNEAVETAEVLPERAERTEEERKKAIGLVAALREKINMIATDANGGKLGKILDETVGVLAPDDDNMSVSWEEAAKKMKESFAADKGLSGYLLPEDFTEDTVLAAFEKREENPIPFGREGSGLVVVLREKLASVGDEKIKTALESAITRLEEDKGSYDNYVRVKKELIDNGIFSDRELAIGALREAFLRDKTEKLEEFVDNKLATGGR